MENIFENLYQIVLSDSTGYQWVSFFEKESEILFGCPSEQFPIGKSKDEEDQAYQKIMSIFGEEKMFLIRVKSNRYNVSFIYKMNEIKKYILES